jgi:hypothetical protein
MEGGKEEGTWGKMMELNGQYQSYWWQWSWEDEAWVRIKSFLVCTLPIYDDDQRTLNQQWVLIAQQHCLLPFPRLAQLPDQDVCGHHQTHLGAAKTQNLCLDCTVFMTTHCLAWERTPIFLNHWKANLILEWLVLTSLAEESLWNSEVMQELRRTSNIS